MINKNEIPRKETKIISEPTRERLDNAANKLISEGWIWAGVWENNGWWCQQLVKYYIGEREIFAKTHDEN